MSRIRKEAEASVATPALQAAHPGWVDGIREYADPAQTRPNVIFKPRPEAV